MDSKSVQMNFIEWMESALESKTCIATDDQRSVMESVNQKSRYNMAHMDNKVDLTEEEMQCFIAAADVYSTMMANLMFSADHTTVH